MTEEYDTPSLWECLCYCNPCWSDDYYDTCETNEEYLINDDNNIPLSSRVEDDTFTLPPDFDPIEDYCTCFDSLSHISGRVKRSSINLVKPETFKEIRLRLKTSTDLNYPSLKSDITLFKIGMTQKDAEERRSNIKDYEFIMNRYPSLREMDAENAEHYADNARNKDNKRSMRLVYFKKAIYYTHDIESKKILWDEYILFCDELKK